MATHISENVDKVDTIRLEQVTSADETLKKDHMDYDRIDKELAKYATSERIYISDEENKRLRKMIDKRILVVMVRETRRQL